MICAIEHVLRNFNYKTLSGSGPNEKELWQCKVKKGLGKYYRMV